MTVIEILRAMEVFGVSLVFLVLIVVWLKPKLDKMWDIILDIKRDTNVVKHESVEDVVQMNACIKNVLQDMMADFQADWCHLWQFHNGIRSMGSRGLPFLYITLTHEVKKTNDPTLLPAFEKVPLTLFNDFVQNLISGDILQHCKEKGVELDGKVDELLEEYGVNHLIMRSIVDENGLLVAFISIGWKNHIEISENDKIKFRNYAQRMSATLARLPDAVLIKC